MRLPIKNREPVQAPHAQTRRAHARAWQRTPMTSAPSAAGSTKHAVVKTAMLVREARVVAMMRRQVADFSKIQDCARAEWCVRARVSVTCVCAPPACCASGAAL
jgi:hypothetical protein